jgi:hypothetical protein
VPEDDLMLFRKKNLVHTRQQVRFGLLVFTVLLLSLSLVPLQSLPASTAKASSTYNYAEALQKAIYFYEEQRSGHMPSTNRVSWRGDSGLTDGSDHGVDLTGGWYDAGDNVKFGLPMASSATMLAWGVVDNRQAYVNSGQLNYILDNIKWADDYFIKAHVSANELYGQVGNGGVDHAWWGAAEVMPVGTSLYASRPSYEITASCPGSDLAGETAAALASSSIIFTATDPTYAATLLSHAKQLYAFADNYRGTYDSCITDASSYYKSYSGYNDELVWGALWLYRATNDATYLTKAQTYYANLSNQSQTTMKSYKWTQSWDDKSYGCYVLMAKLTGQTQYMQDAERWLDWWTVGYGGDKVKYTPGGLAWLDTWGVLRYASNTSFEALVYSNVTTDPVKKARYHDFAVSQINYILGSNPQNRSYEVGFGTNPPRDVHHRSAHGTWTNNLQGLPVDDRHDLIGALVGGPDASDGYTDTRSNYQQNEPATDYNAAFVGALAYMYNEFGGTALTNFPVAETPDPDEFFVAASINSSNSNYTEIRAQINNHSAWPARAATDLSFRYFVDLTEFLNAGYKPTDVTITVPYTQGAKASALTKWNGNIYYTTLDFTGVNVAPVSQSVSVSEVQFRMTVPTGAAWDPTNDPSYKNLTSSSLNETAYIPVYEGSKKLYGQEPSGTPVTTTTSVVTTTTPTPTTTTPVVTTTTPTPTTTTPVKTTTTPVVTTTTPTPTTTTPIVTTTTPVVTTTTPIPTTTVAVGQYSVQYSISSQWNTGYNISVTVVNNSGSPVNNWTISWQLAHGETFANYWNAQCSISGSTVTCSNMSYNATLGANGGSQNFGAQFNSSSGATTPTSFTVNGVTVH